MNKSTHAVVLAALCLALAACSGGSGNSRIDYKKEAETLPSLDVPPDLTAPANTGVEEIPTVAGSAELKVLPHSKGIEIEHDGARRWLLINASAEKLWPKLRKFWPSLGLELALDEPKTGIMETTWAENRADAPKGFFADMVKKVFRNAYSAGTRDKFRLRLEPRKDGKVELFVTHYGLKEVVTTDQSGSIAQTGWVVRPSDPELANEVMNRLVLFLGGNESTARQVVAKAPAATAAGAVAKPRIRLEGDALVMDDGFSRAWRLTGIALDRLGLVVEDRNRSEGIYYVGKVELAGAAGEDNKSWLGNLLSSGEKGAEQSQRRILLRGDEQTTRISVLDQQGNPDHSAVAVTILQRLQEAMQ